MTDELDSLVDLVKRGPRERALVCPSCKTGTPELTQGRYVCPCGVVYSALGLLDAVPKKRSP